jgi:hypothetical protein
MKAAELAVGAVLIFWAEFFMPLMLWYDRTDEWREIYKEEQFEMQLFLLTNVR